MSSPDGSTAALPTAATPAALTALTAPAASAAPTAIVPAPGTAAAAPGPSAADGGPGTGAAVVTSTGDAPRTGGRLVGVDAARGIALIGMMAVHSLYVVDEAGDPTVAGAIAGGRSAALFAVLSGVGIAFATRRRRVVRGEIGRTTRSLLARAAVVGAIGLALGQIASVALGAVILPYYAVLFAAAVPLVLLGRHVLLFLGISGAVAIPFLSHHLRAGLPAPTLQNPTFGALFTDPVGLGTELAVTGFYPALSWLPYLCVGIAIGRMRLDLRGTATALLLWGAGLAVAARAASEALLSLGALDRIRADAAAQGMSARWLDDVLASGPEGVTPATNTWWLAIDSPHSSTPFDLLHTIGTSAAVIGAMLLLGHLANPVVRPVVDAVLRPLAAAGGMTLTFYTAHILFLNSPFDVYSAETGYALQVAAVLVLGLGWRLTAGRGPLERLVGRAAAAASR